MYRSSGSKNRPATSIPRSTSASSSCRPSSSASSSWCARTCGRGWPRHAPPLALPRIPSADTTEKIDQHLSYYLSASANPASQSTFTSAAPAPLLSAAERAYAESHHALLDRTYRAAFLARFPPSLQGLADTAGGIAMAEPPAPDRAVFVRALADGREHVAVAGTDIDFRMRGGEVFAVRWSAVRGAVLRGEAELI